MSARNVCSGIRPSRYHSVRAISAPFRRPETRTFTPSAPLRMVLITARFMARRNITRFSICCAMLSATSCASSSGFLISEMLSRTSVTGISRSFAVSWRSFSMSSPFLPITMPGRAVSMVMFTFFAARSMWMRLTEASASRPCRNSRTRKSVCTCAANCFLPAYHFDIHSRVMPSRMPSGLTFWPMISILLAVAHGHRDVAVALDDASPAALRARREALQHRRGVHLDARDRQVVHVEPLVLLRVRDRGPERLVDKPRALLGHVFQRVERLVDRLAADRVGDEPALLRRDACVAQDCGDFCHVRAPQVAASTFLSPECALNVRVGANSPNLWPTMFSVTRTGMCCRPLWTAIVRPTMSGTIIERRDQVLIGFLSLRAEATCTFFARCRSTKGPFLRERGMSDLLSHFVPAALNDHAVRPLVVARLQALGVPAPRRHGMRIALPGFALAAAVRVIDRVHRKPAHRRPHAAPADGARLAVAAQVVLVVAHFADRRAAVDVHAADLGRFHPEIGVCALARRVLGGAAGAARELAALAGLELDVVDQRADGNVPQLHRIARLDRSVGAGADFLPGRHPLRRENVPALAVGVAHERDVRRAVRIVLDPLDHARDAVLVPLEVDDAVLLPRAAADVARRDAAEVVASAGLALRHRERRIRLALVQVRAVDLDDAARAGRGRFELDECHVECRGATPSPVPRSRSSARARGAHRPSSSPACGPPGGRSGASCRAH